ncbi:tetratricopeptide repeat protein [Desulfovibrio cuneatus]|uniref:tetratricopeptide repeat protein n=1 Tax=Desulfovibrio cuneatus TaxID=159728 RepID=UPI000419DDB3|nr:tetratricopeptide repeat protein [Desulfovibrio cuneatus]
MESAKFIGTFLALPLATDFGLSLAQPNTLWQAWQRADGTFWINGLDNAGLQTNANYTIPGELLHSAFNALPQATTARPKLSAHSSTLLQHWFKRRTQASGTTLHQLATPSLPDEDGPKRTAKAAQASMAQDNSLQDMPQDYAMEVHSHIGYESDESGFADPGFIAPIQMQPQPQLPEQPQMQFQGQPQPQFIMDNTCFEPGQPAQSAFPQPPVPAVPVDMTAHLAPSAQGAQFTTPVSSPVPAAKSPLDNLNEGRRKVIEQAMRQEFTLLLDHMSNEQNAMTLRDMEELIRRQIPNSWQMKYMFSEFGLALRKEQQHQLALLCHQRALECSPNDANVLFNLARTEVELGAMAAARMHLAQALEAAPDFTAAKNFLAFLSSR